MKLRHNYHDRILLDELYDMSTLNPYIVYPLLTYDRECSYKLGDVIFYHVIKKNN